MLSFSFVFLFDFFLTLKTSKRLRFGSILIDVFDKEDNFTFAKEEQVALSNELQLVEDFLKDLELHAFVSFTLSSFIFFRACDFFAYKEAQHIY